MQVYRVLSTAGATRAHTHTHEKPYTYLSMHYTYVPICTYLYRMYVYIRTNGVWGGGGRVIIYVCTVAGGR